MKLMFDQIRLKLAQEVHSQIRNLFNHECTIEEIYNGFVPPPNPEMGDVAFGCFTLAKALKKSPPVIAKGLAEKISPNSLIKKAEGAGPYLNFFINSKSLGELTIDSIITGDFFKGPFTKQQPKTMVEYSQPNTHKELHVGHMRNLCLGDAIVRTMRYAGFEVIASTFPGDQGTHVAKCLWYLKYHNKETAPKEHRGEWIGRMYSLGHLKLEDELGTPQEEKNREQLTAILKELENKKGPFFDLWKETRSWSVELMEQVYKWADVKFDKWYWESEVDKDSMTYVQDLFKSGKLVKSEGAIGMDLSEDNLGFCLLIKSDGTGLYATKDLELARRKFQEFHIDSNIYIVDMRQALHFKQVFKVLEKLGFEKAKHCYHLQYNFVELPDGAMSSRKGNIVPLTDLIHKMEQTITERYLSRYSAEWSAEEIRKTSEIVAKGAIKYGMVRMDPNKKIVFDMDDWLRLDGESGPFIQYSYARVNSLCQKLKFDPNIKVDWKVLVERAEHQLAMLLTQFNHVCVTAAENHKPSLICNYLFDVAKQFNQFYHDCPINQAPTEDLKWARLRLSAATGKTLKEGLGLIGIPVPERM